MNPPMYLRLKDLFIDAGLTAGLTVQWRQWRDTNKSAAFIVFMPNGGSSISNDRGGDHYVLVSVVGAVDKPDAAEDAVTAIVEYITAQTGADDCVGALQLVGGFPRPIPTEENRLVWQLNISCTWGE
ncbi:hypothetical protein [Pantoea sp. App145]|uniref:phage tail termination protein n=1 Tax=Pantoea sp. App145 TaxID=3071567 RepID=UPI003A802846